MQPGLKETTCAIACAPAEYHPHKGARTRRNHVSYCGVPAEYHPHKGVRSRRDHVSYMPIFLLSTILIREPGLEETTCPSGCAPADYHPYKGARPRRDHVVLLCSC